MSSNLLGVMAFDAWLPEATISKTCCENKYIVLGTNNSSSDNYSQKDVFISAKEIVVEGVRKNLFKKFYQN